MPTATKRPTRPRRTSSPSRKIPRNDATTRYAADVVDGKIVAGRLVRLACQRHLRDLDRSDLRWDLALATRAIGFFRDVLRLNGGDFEGKPFELSPWQAFVVGSLFGWLGEDGYRRFRVAYIEIAKGNGKSPLAAGVGHYCLSADKEARAEVYAAATKKDQAMILFRDAVAMWEQSPALRARLKASGAQPNIWNLADLNTGSFFRPISSDDGQSGPRPHCGLIDELHEHKSGNVVDMMRAGTKGRKQALIFEITNSGFDRHSICRQHHEYSVRVLEGAHAPGGLEDDSWFAFVCGLDRCAKCQTEGVTTGCTDCDQWTDEAVWPKANPNLGVSVTLKYLREQVREAVGMPGKQNIVRRLNFCEWTEQDERWIDMPLWDRGAKPIDLVALQGRTCFGGLDLGQVNDLSALALVFPPILPDEPWKVLMRYWCPKDDILRRSKKDGVPYEVWEREGFLKVTPGNSTDFGFIQKEIIDLHSVYRIEGIAFDRMFSGQIIQNLTSEGVVMIQFGQGFLSMAAPTKELSRLLLAEELQHGGHPVLRWNASNVTVAEDPAGNQKPDKARSTERIDGVVAVIDALGIAHKAEVDTDSIYNSGQGLTFL